MNPPAATPAPIRRHSRFVKTPVISDVLTLAVYPRGQWIFLAWNPDKPSRFHSIDSRGNVVAFHYPNAARKFALYCAAGRALPSIHRAKPLSARAKTLLTAP